MGEQKANTTSKQSTWVMNVMNNPVDLYTCNVKQFNALSSPNSITRSLLSNMCMTDNLKKSFAWNLYKKNLWLHKETMLMN